MRSTALAEHWGGEQADSAAMTQCIFISPAFGSEQTLNRITGYSDLCSKI